MLSDRRPWFGPAAGSADPLIWAQAQYVRLIRDLQARRILDQPSITRARYVARGAPTAVPLRIKVSAPGAVTTPGHVSTTPPGMTEDILASQEPRMTTTRSQASVTGTTAPGAIVEIAVGRPGSAANTSTVVQAAAGPGGRFRATIPTPPGKAIVTVTATAGGHATGWAQQACRAGRMARPEQPAADVRWRRRRQPPRGATGEQAGHHRSRGGARRPPA